MFPKSIISQLRLHILSLPTYFNELEFPETSSTVVQLGLEAYFLVNVDLTMLLGTISKITCSTLY